MNRWLFRSQNGMTFRKFCYYWRCAPERLDRMMFWLLSGCKTILALFLVLEQQPFFVLERHICRSSKCFFAPKEDRIQPLGGRRYSIDLGSPNCRNSDAARWGEQSSMWKNMDGDIHARYLKLACLSVCLFVAHADLKSWQPYLLVITEFYLVFLNL